MSTRPRDIGTFAETAVARWARSNGFPHADRLTGHGRNDIGDVLLEYGAIVEVKGGEAARKASDLLIGKWLDETEVERVNSNASVGFLVTQRAAVGAPNAGRWWAWWRAGWLTRLSGQVETFAPQPHVILRCTLGDSLLILRASGFGLALPADDDPDVDIADE